MVSEAHGYASRGWPVFPLLGKVPRTRRGFKDASTDPAQLEEWWRRWPEAGVAIATGAAGLRVLDVDPRHGGDEALYELEREHGKLPRTPRVKTGGGGEHHYFAGSGRSGKLAEGLEIKSEGGYVVAVPSLHPDTNRPYEWDVGPNEAKLASPPEWLLARTPEAKPRSVLEWRQLAADGVPAGERNERTAQLAGHLLARGIDPYVTLELLTAWDAQRNRPPLDPEEIAQVVSSIAVREARQWRT